MGGTCYLKNQGQDPKNALGSDQLNQNMIDSIERHAKGSCKDLISLMQINKKFIKKICNCLSKRVAEPIYTAELRLLGLVLIRELMLTPIKKRDPKQRKNHHNQGRSGSLQNSSEYIFCILNEKQIFTTIKDTTGKALQGCISGQEKEKNNAPFFIHESLQIFNVLLTTLQKSQLLENEDDYLEFITPFISFNEKNSGQVHQAINSSYLGQTIYFETYNGFFKLIQQMKENSFRQKFPSILKTTWSLIQRAQLTFQSLKTLESQNESAINIEDIHIYEIQQSKDVSINAGIHQRSMISPRQNPIIERPSMVSQTNTNSKEHQYQLHQIGFDILRYLSQKLSSDVENEDQIQAFLLPIFEYFNNQDKWQSSRFAKFTLLTVIYNQQNNEKLIDYQMLDYVCETFLRYLVKDIILERPPGEAGSPQLNEKEAEKTLFIKRNLLEVFCEIMSLVSYENNIRQFNVNRYFDSLVLIIQYLSVANVESQLQYEIEKQIKIFTETYLTKIDDTEQLISVLDYLIGSIQDEVLSQNNNQLMPLINKIKVKNVLSLIEAVIYFILNHIDSQQSSSGNLQSDNQPQKVSNVLAKRKSGIIKFRRIKDSHLILLMSLAKRCLDDGYTEQTETALVLSAQMLQINQDLMFSGELRQREMSQDFVTRYLNSIGDFIRTDLESVVDMKCMFGPYIFDIWRLIIVPLDKNVESQSSILAFLVSLLNLVTKANLQRKSEARYRVLYFFMNGLASLVFDIRSVVNALMNIKQLEQIDDLFWSKLPSLNKQELLLQISQKLDALMSQDLYEEEQVKQALLLKYENMNPKINELFESYLESKNLPATQMRQQVEIFRHTESRQQNNLAELSQKKQNSFDMNHKFMMQSMSMTDLNDSILSSHRSNIFEENQNYNLNSKTAIPQNMLLGRANTQFNNDKNKLVKSDSLCSEYLNTQENGAQESMRIATLQLKGINGVFDEYQIDQNFN
eukprot:403372517